jgi:hypothetical protein
MKIDLHATSTVVAILGLLITIMLGSMWMGELSNSVTYLKQTTVNGERIARIEARLEALVDGQSRLSLAIDSLATRIDQTENRPR